MYASSYSEIYPDEAGAVHGLASSMTSSLTSNIGSSPTTPTRRRLGGVPSTASCAAPVAMATTNESRDRLNGSSMTRVRNIRPDQYQSPASSLHRSSARQWPGPAVWLRDRRQPTVKTKLAVVMASIMLPVAGCAPQEMDGRYDVLAPLAAPSSLIQAGLSDSAFAMDCPVGEEDDGYGGCVPCRDYEGCFTKSADMRYFFALIVELIRGYSADTYQSMPDVDAWHFVTLGESGQEGCTDGSGRQAAFTDESDEYCPLDHVIYVGEQQMWDFYTNLGDAAPAVGIAHEWGHHLQAVAGLTSTTQSETIALEDQADCVAGAWSKWLTAKEVMVDGRLRRHWRVACRDWIDRRSRP